MKPGELKIHKALMDHEEGLTFTQLKNETGLSAPVLSEYLKSFTIGGFIEKDIQRRYRLRRTFLPTKKLSDRERMMKFITASSFLLGVEVMRVKDEEKRLELMREFLKTYLLHAGSLMVWGTINYSLDKWEMTGVKGKRTIRDLWLILNEQIGNWIAPLIEKLALIIAFNVEDFRKNEDVIEKIADLWLKQFMKWIHLLKKHEKILRIEDKTFMEMVDEVKRSYGKK